MVMYLLLMRRWCHIIHVCERQIGLFHVTFEVWQVLRVRVGDEVRTLTDFCGKAGNTIRRVQQCIMVADSDPPMNLAEWIIMQVRL